MLVDTRGGGTEGEKNDRGMKFPVWESVAIFFSWLLRICRHTVLLVLYGEVINIGDNIRDGLQVTDNGKWIRFGMYY